MQLRLFAQILPGVALALVLIATTASSQPSYAESNKFFCAEEKGVPVTKVRTSRGNETFIRWVVKDFKKFPPQQRCTIVTKRFQRYYDNGALFITSRNNVNGYPVLCISDRKNAPCTTDNILVTLKPGADAGVVLKQMLDFRSGANATGGIPLSGSQYVTYEQGDLYLDVKQLVDSADSGNSNQSVITTPQSQPVEPRF
jgi:hypothetical protein